MVWMGYTDGYALSVNDRCALQGRTGAFLPLSPAADAGRVG